MIGSLRGQLVEKNPPFLLIEVNGIGYDVQTSMTTFYQLPEVDETVFIYIQMVIREDAQLLYGFATQTERLVFRELIKVSGVGPKLALAILSGMDVLNFGRCIENKETAQLVKIPGVGKKTAERLIVEMRDRLSKYMPDSEDFSKVLLEKSIQGGGQKARQDAISALLALGYKQQDAMKVINQLTINETDSSETLIRLALQQLAKG